MRSAVFFPQPADCCLHTSLSCRAKSPYVAVIYYYQPGVPPASPPGPNARAGRGRPLPGGCGEHPLILSQKAAIKLVCHVNVGPQQGPVQSLRSGDGQHSRPAVAGCLAHRRPGSHKSSTSPRGRQAAEEVPPFWRRKPPTSTASTTIRQLQTWVVWRPIAPHRQRGVLLKGSRGTGFKKVVSAAMRPPCLGGSPLATTSMRRGHPQAGHPSSCPASKPLPPHAPGGP